MGMWKNRNVWIILSGEMIAGLRVMDWNYWQS